MLIEIYLIHRWNIVVVFIPSRKFARTIEANLSRCVSLVHWKTLLRFRIGNFLLLAGFIVLTLVSKRFKLLLPFQHGKPLPEGRSSGCPNGRRRLLGISRFLMDASVFQRRMVLFDRHPNIPECLGRLVQGPFVANVRIHISAGFLIALQKPALLVFHQSQNLFDNRDLGALGRRLVFVVVFSQETIVEFVARVFPNAFSPPAEDVRVRWLYSSGGGGCNKTKSHSAIGGRHDFQSGACYFCGRRHAVKKQIFDLVTGGCLV
mmetsp:Transcript_16592/g.41563  ORF Transcript_16592/g.41563 Transcript_16592/m.41563 type:complete len:262 (+) Transcript_16592:1790-2575(+)